MTDQLEPTEAAAEASRLRTRRALLAGIFGGAAAWAAGTALRVSQTEAAAGNPMILGAANSAGTASTTLSTTNSGAAMGVKQLGGGTALSTEATSGTGLYAKTGSTNRFALFAESVAGSIGTGGAIRANGNKQTALRAETSGANVSAIAASHLSSSPGSGAAVLGTGGYAFGVQGTSEAVGVSGRSTTGIGVEGQSASGIAVAGHSDSDTGVFGASVLGDGIRGGSASGKGVHGSSSSGYAGYFDDEVFFHDYLDIDEIPSPAAPLGGRARLFARDNGSGKTQLCVLFSTGVVQVVAVQP